MCSHKINLRILDHNFDEYNTKSCKLFFYNTLLRHYIRLAVDRVNIKLKIAPHFFIERLI